ncbi:AzlD domain-containing protein [Spiractinospora alimapuensis]|uniref:AzlD domain-containing protein n=1 Tax=Spiractinospora alimapuensis TaxID=2820884 RepID=UPI001F257DD1|nr:AzlD domain-containing protein [Spiractinospora alimapuensis]QVQ53115.1 AzlD domain-containing protein [Spiractinospora alimapuensis]
MSMWIAVLVTGVGCLLLKVVGMTAPRRLLDNPRIADFATIVPVALLAALIGLETFTSGQSLTVDVPRVAAVAAAAVALALRAPFLVVLLVAAATAAGLRAVGVG